MGRGRHMGTLGLGVVHVSGFSRKNMGILGHKRAHIRGFTGVGHGDPGANGGAHVRGFSRRLPAEPTISPRVQNAWPRKSCRIRNTGCHQGDAHPRKAREAGLTDPALTCLERSGLLESTSYLGAEGTCGHRTGRGGLGWDRDENRDGDRDGMGGRQGVGGMG